MCKMMTVVRYEYKMQFQRPASWGILIAAVLFSLADNYPSAGNLERLEFLNQPAYFTYRVMHTDSLVLLFGLLFLLAGRLPLDHKTGMKSLLMASPLRKWQYLWGKLLGGLLFTFSMLCIFLGANTAVYFGAAPFEIHVADCIVPLLKAAVVSAFPASLFVSFCSVALPGMIDLRLFYLLAAVVFWINVGYVGSAEAVPFWLITSGDLARLIWVHPKWPFVDWGSVAANGMFLIVGGLFLGSLVFWKPRFWRCG